MNYIDNIAWLIITECGGDVVERSMTSFDLYRGYAVLLLAKGADVTAEDVHNAWAAWQASVQPDHRSLVPFGSLSKKTQALDTPYVAAIHKIAQRLSVGATND